MEPLLITAFSVVWAALWGAIGYFGRGWMDERRSVRAEKRTARRELRQKQLAALARILGDLRANLETCLLMNTGTAGLEGTVLGQLADLCAVKAPLLPENVRGALSAVRYAALAARRPAGHPDRIAVSGPEGRRELERAWDILQRHLDLLQRELHGR